MLCRPYRNIEIYYNLYWKKCFFLIIFDCIQSGVLSLCTKLGQGVENILEWLINCCNALRQNVCWFPYFSEVMNQTIDQLLIFILNLCMWILQFDWLKGGLKIVIETACFRLLIYPRQIHVLERQMVYGKCLLQPFVMLSKSKKISLKYIYINTQTV